MIDVLDTIMANANRDELEDMVNILIGILGRIETNNSSFTFAHMNCNRLEAENAKLKADIEGLRKIIDNERAAAEGR